MSVPVCHRISLAVAETPAIAMRFMARPEEARLLEARIRSHMDPAAVGVEVAVDERQATSAAAMVRALLDSLPADDVSLKESVDRDQLGNVALKLDFCVAMARDVADPAPRLGEVVVRFRRIVSGAAAGGEETCRVTMTDPAADQDTDALVGLFTRALGSVLMTHGHAAHLSVAQQPVAAVVGSADEAVTGLLRALDAAGLASHADRLQAAFPEGAVLAPGGAAPDGDAGAVLAA